MTDPMIDPMTVKDTDQNEQVTRFRAGFEESASVLPTRYVIPGVVDGETVTLSELVFNPHTDNGYMALVQQCRYYYEIDPLASTVLNRMVEVALTELVILKGTATDQELAYYEYVINTQLVPMLVEIFTEYLLCGAVFTEFDLVQQRANKYAQLSVFGRRVLKFPEYWIRPVDALIWKRDPLRNRLLIYQRIPQEHIELVYAAKNGTLKDPELIALYRVLEEDHPQYIEAILEGKESVLLRDSNPILRKSLSHSPHPKPYLAPALSPLEHKNNLRKLDKSIAKRAIEAVMLVRVGNDKFPVSDESPLIRSIKAELAANRKDASQIYRLIVPHVVEAEWVYPPLDALLDSSKYDAIDGDIFNALGFSQAMVTGENKRSNAGSSVVNSAGPIAAVNEMRKQFISWLDNHMHQLREANDFKGVPELSFTPVLFTDLQSISQVLLGLLDKNRISSDTVLRMVGSSWKAEQSQLNVEGQDTPVQDTPVQNAPTVSPEVLNERTRNT